MLRLVRQRAGQWPRVKAAGNRLTPTSTRVLGRWNSTEAAQNLLKTPLYELHIANEAKMVPFGGFSMPLTYPSASHLQSHHHVREACGLFDVSHMVQSLFTGVNAAAFLESITPSSLKSLSPFRSTLSVLTNESGGIIDDLMISKLAEDKFYVVTNAGRRDTDLPWFKKQLSAFAQSAEAPTMEVLEGWGLVALQGPFASSVLQELTDFQLSTLTFSQLAYVPIFDSANDTNVDVLVSRGGYTGEDGFEISLPPHIAEQFTKELAESEDVQLAGLAARDSLRLEAGLCLYGHDLDESIGVGEAGLSWVVGKDRRLETSSPFVGSHAVLKQLEDIKKKSFTGRRRIGLVVQGAPAREGAKIFAPSGESPVEIGVVTSGGPSPTLAQNIAMGYVSSPNGEGYHKKETPLLVQVRGKMREAKVVGMPFVPTKYYRG